MSPQDTQPGTGIPAGTPLPDSPRFLGEGRLSQMPADLKAKIAFGVASFVVLLVMGVSLKNRWAQDNVVDQTPNGAARIESTTDRKPRIFALDQATPSTPPPIVLPGQGKLAPSAFNPTGLDLPSLTLAAPPQAPAAPRPMMVAEGRPPLPTPSPTSTTVASSTVMPLPIPPNATKDGEASPSNVPTVQGQALLVRERQGAQVTATAQVSAAHLGRRSFVLTKGSFIPCVLETQLVSNVFGMTSCVVTQNVYSDDGKLVLIERGAKVSGNYGSNMRTGDSRLAVIWDRIKTPKGVIVDVNSPGSDGLGAMGLPGHVDNHWWDRIGSAFLLSLLQDSLQYATSSLAYQNYLKEQREIAAIQPPPQTTNTTQTTVTKVDPSTGTTTTTVTTSGQTPSTNAGRGNSSTPPAIPVFGANNTVRQGGSIPEQVLAASINAAPTLYKNRGEVVYIYVANDIWFDRVYGLKE